MKLNHDIDQGNTDEHLHSGLYQITHCPGGVGLFKILPLEFKTDPCCFYIANPNELHGLQSIPGTNFQNCTCRFELPGYEGKLLMSEVRLEATEAAHVYGLFCQIQSKVLAGHEMQLIQAGLLLTEALLIFERSCRRQEQEQLSVLVRQAIAYISEHFSKGISINDVVVHCGVSASHLSRIFRKETGGTLLAYLHRVRLGHAMEQLFRTNMKISDIAIASGFENTKNLNMTFRRVYNITPSEFRKRHYEENPIDQVKED